MQIYVRDLEGQTQGVACDDEWTVADLKAHVDLRPYIDAAPFMATTLMPLPRVYRLFNQARAAARAAAPPPPPPLPHPSHAPSTCHRSARGTCPCSIVERSSSA